MCLLAGLMHAAPLCSASLALASSHPHVLLSLQPELPFSGAAGWGSCLLQGSARQFFMELLLVFPVVWNGVSAGTGITQSPGQVVHPHTYTHSALMGESLLAGLGMAGTTSAFGPQPECKDVKMDWQELV